MTKIVFILLLGVGFGTFVGRFFVRRLSEKKAYFCGLCDFTTAFINNLSFKQDKLYDFVSQQKNLNHDVFSVQLKNYLEFLNGGKLVISDMVAADEKEKIALFFNNLGKVDVLTQRKILDEYIVYFNQFREKSEKNLEKNGKLYQKLCILGGIAIAIVIL